jgi:ABC-type uncharacterized transport system ATPase component
MSTDDTGFIDYVSFRRSTYLNYHRAIIDPQDNGPLMIRTKKFVEQDLPTRVLITSNDPRSMLELGVR